MILCHELVRAIFKHFSDSSFRRVHSPCSLSLSSGISPELQGRDRTALSRVAGSGALRPASPLGLPASRGSHGAGAPDGTGLKSLFCPARAALETTAFAPRIRTRPPSRRPPRLRPPCRARTRMRHLGRPPWTPRRRGNAQRGARARSGVRTPRASSARSPRRCGHHGWKLDSACRGEAAEHGEPG